MSKSVRFHMVCGMGSELMFLQKWIKKHCCIVLCSSSMVEFKPHSRNMVTVSMAQLLTTWHIQYANESEIPLQLDKRCAHDGITPNQCQNISKHAHRTSDDITCVGPFLSLPSIRFHTHDASKTKQWHVCKSFSQFWLKLDIFRHVFLIRKKRFVFCIDK